MSLTNIRWHEVEMEAVDAQRRAPEEMSIGLSIGKPLVMALQDYASEINRPELKRELESADLYYVRIPISLRGPNALQVALLSVDVDLNNDASSAIAWSMFPMRVETPLRTVFDQLVLPGGKLAGDHGTLLENTEVHYEPYVEAFGLGTKAPAWELRPVKNAGLSGIKVFHLIVRQDKNSITQSSIKVRVDKRDTRGAIVKLLAKKPAHSAHQLEFALDRRGTPAPNVSPAPAVTPDTADVFISYASEDRDLVKQLVEQISAYGYSVWYDQNLVGGEWFRKEIVVRLNAARIVVVFWSEHSAESPWVIYEATSALEAKKMLPILATGFDIKNVPPPFSAVANFIRMEDSEGLRRSLGKSSGS